jgi:hypothetical protein
MPTPRTRGAALTTAAGLALTGLLVSFTLAGSSAAVTATTQDVVRQTNAETHFYPSGGSTFAVYPIYALPLPSGSWVVTATLTLVNWGPSDYVRCQIDAMYPSAAIGSATTTVGNTTQSGNIGAASTVSTLTVIGAATITGNPAYVEVACWHDTTRAAGVGLPFIDPGATLLAHKSTELDVGTAQINGA